MEIFKLNITPLTYTLIMWLLIIFQVIFSMWVKTCFSWLGVGFLVGLWLGNWLRWVLIK